MAASGADAARQQRQQPSTELPATVATVKVKKRRRSADDIRRDQKRQTLQELEQLEDQLAVLKRRALFPDRASELHASGERRDLENRLLRQAVRDQQVAVARVQASLSAFTTQQRTGPFSSAIRLDDDSSRRKNVLRALYSEQLEEAERFIEQRSLDLDRGAFIKTEDQFESKARDFFVQHFDISPLRGAPSVRSVFDAMLGIALNVEISMSETLETVAIREDDDYTKTERDYSIAHHRLVATNRYGVVEESNTIMFSRFDDDACGGLGRGLCVANYVEQDALNPYRPQERARRDFTTIVTISPTAETTIKSGDAGLAVTMTRWSLSKLHHTDIQVPANAWQTMQDNTGKWIDAVVKDLRTKYNGVVQMTETKA